MTELEILIEARRQVENCWFQGDTTAIGREAGSHHDSGGDTTCAGLGLYITGGSVDTPALARYANLCPEWATEAGGWEWDINNEQTSVHYKTIVKFNNDSTTTKQDVLDLFDLAIAECKLESVDSEVSEIVAV